MGLELLIKAGLADPNPEASHMDGLGVVDQSNMDWLQSVAETSHTDGLGVVAQSNMDCLVMTLKLARRMELE